MKRNKKSLFLAYMEKMRLENKIKKYNFKNDENVIFIDNSKLKISNMIGCIFDIIKSLIISIFVILITVLVSIGITVIFNSSFREVIIEQIFRSC